MNDSFAVFLIATLIVIVAVSEVMAAVLPTLIVILMVPPEERAVLAELIASTRRPRGFGIAAAMRLGWTTRGRTRASGRVPGKRPCPDAAPRTGE